MRGWGGGGNKNEIVRVPSKIGAFYKWGMWSLTFHFSPYCRGWKCNIEKFVGLNSDRAKPRGKLKFILLGNRGTFLALKHKCCNKMKTRIFYKLWTELHYIVDIRQSCNAAVAVKYMIDIGKPLAWDTWEWIERVDIDIVQCTKWEGRHACPTNQTSEICLIWSFGENWRWPSFGRHLSNIYTKQAKGMCKRVIVCL